MKWRIEYSNQAKKFIGEQNIQDVNIDLKKLVGDWEGYYRIRIGKMRIIFFPVKL